MPGRKNNGSVVKGNRGTLKAGGLRATSQRAIILEIIKQSGQHLDADEIYRIARRREPRISLSTVYRSLQRFKEIGLIGESHFDDSHHHYEVKASSEHHHLVCLGCGRVTEFDFDLSRHIAGNVPEAAGFEISEIELRAAGYCADCRR